MIVLFLFILKLYCVTLKKKEVWLCVLLKKTIIYLFHTYHM